jgi:hypothetical protein
MIATSTQGESFRAESNELRHQLATAEQAIREAQQERDLVLEKLSTSEQKVKKLHKLILESGLSSTGPTDEEIQRRFSGLRHSLFQFVKRHCTNYHARVKDDRYDALNTEAKDFWVMSTISRSLYLSFFREGAVIYGFDHVTDENLRKFYDSVSTTTTGNDNFPLRHLYSNNFSAHRRTSRMESAHLRYWQVMGRRKSLPRGTSIQCSLDYLEESQPLHAHDQIASIFSK